MKKLHWLLSSQFGFDPLRFLRSLHGLPRFIRDWREFRRGHGHPLLFKPCLHDRFKEGGTTKSEYFWQDLLVARWIFEAKPDRHVDIGSRIDGFVAHVASFREIEVFDVRPVTTQIPGIVFRQANLMDAASLPPSALAGGYCDSLSCLHAIEHFGLGRYGDPIDSRGYAHGLGNMATLLKPGGTLYLATPIGRERVEFNANWVFDPRTILDEAKRNHLEIQRLHVFDPPCGMGVIDTDETALTDLAAKQYHLAIFIFNKARQICS